MDEGIVNPEVAAAFLITWLRLIYDGPEMSNRMEVDTQTAKLATDLVVSFAETEGRGPLTAATFHDCLGKMDISMTQGPEPAPQVMEPVEGHHFPKLCTWILNRGTGMREWICFDI